jgi:hypothetical protein
MRDCCKKSIAKIPKDEPVFCLFARDSLSTDVIRYWIELAEKNKVNDDKILRAKGHLQDFEDFQVRFPERKHLPD